MREGKIVIISFSAVIALALAALSAEIMREYFIIVPSDEAAWLDVAAWLFFFFSGLSVLGVAVTGIVLAVLSAHLRKTTIAVAVVLVVCWLFLPLSPTIADRVYNSTGFTRLSPDEMTEVREGQFAIVADIAEDFGDSVEFDEAQSEYDVRRFAVINGDDIPQITVEWFYWSNFGRLEVVIETQLSVASGGEFDFGQLYKAAQYCNALTCLSLTAEECENVALSEEYTEYSHDGYAVQLKSYSKFNYVRCRFWASEDDFGKKDNADFTFYGLSKFGEGV